MYSNEYYGWQPFTNEQLNLASGSYDPSTIRPYNNMAFSYWARSLYQRMVSSIEFELPEDWKGNIKSFFQWVIFARGYAAVFNSQEFGESFQPCNLWGIDFYYQPVKAVIYNPKYQAELEIDKECGIVQITPDYRGVIDIVVYYAEKLALLDNALNTSLINNKISFIIGAKTKAAAAALKKILDKVNRGDPAVIYDQRIADDPATHETPFQFFERSHAPKDYYLTPDQLRDIQTLINAFDAEIGIPTVPYQKQERMVNAEAQSKSIDSKARCETWVDLFNSSAERAEKATGIHLHAEVANKGEENGTDFSNDISIQSAEVLQ